MKQQSECKLCCLFFFIQVDWFVSSSCYCVFESSVWWTTVKRCNTLFLFPWKDIFILFISVLGFLYLLARLSPVSVLQPLWIWLLAFSSTPIPFSYCILCCCKSTWMWICSWRLPFLTLPVEMGENLMSRIPHQGRAPFLIVQVESGHHQYGRVAMDPNSK